MKRIDRLALRGFMVGSLIGDGSIPTQRYTTPKCRYSEGHSAEFGEYMRWKADFIAQALPVTYTIGERKDPRNGSVYINFVTTTSKFFWKLRNIFYQPDGKRQMPFEFVEKYFNELALAVLFMDDGNLEFSSTGLFKTAEIYTMSYQYDEVVWFRDFIEKRFGLNFSVRTRRNKYHFLSLGVHEKIKKFIDIIKPHIHESMYYKAYFDYRRVDPAASFRHPPIKIGYDEYIVRLLMKKN